MRKETADIAVEEIRRCVWWGVYHTHEIVDEVEAAVYPDEIDLEWVESRMEEEFQKKEAQELAVRLRLRGFSRKEESRIMRA